MSSRVPAIGKFGNPASINTSGSKLKLKSSRGVIKKDLDQNSSANSAKKLKIKLKPRNFMTKPEESSTTSTKNVRRSRGLRSSFNNKPISPTYNNTQRQPISYSDKLGEKQ